MAFPFFKKKDKKAEQKEQPKSAKGGSASGGKQKVSAKDKSVTEGEKPQADAVKEDTVPEVAEQTVKQVQTESTNTGKKAQNFSSGVHYIVRPHVTEKATALAEHSEYVFVIAPNATKQEVQKSVKQIYGVDVERVRIVQVHSKKMRLGRIQGIKKGYKKAIVKLKHGQKLDILPR